MTANWLIVSGFFLLVFGAIMRVSMMMRSSDATDAEAPVLYGRELVSHYRSAFPASAAPLLTRGSLISGCVLLLAGLAAEAVR